MLSSDLMVAKTLPLRFRETERFFAVSPKVLGARAA